MSNHGPGLSCSGGSAFQMKECLVQANHGSGVCIRGNSKGQLSNCRFVRNGGILVKEEGSSCSPCVANVAVVSSAHQLALPGFRMVNDNESSEEAVVPNEQSSG